MDRPPRIEVTVGEDAFRGPIPKGFGSVRVFSRDRRKFGHVVVNMSLWDEDRRLRAWCIREAREQIRRLGPEPLRLD